MTSSKIAQLDLTKHPVATPSEPSNGLKHLNFVSDAAAAATSVPTSLYKQARQYTPSSAENLLANVEGTVAAYAAPVVASASDVGEKLLSRADDQVDYVAKLTTSTIKSGQAQLAHGRKALSDNIDHVRSGKFYQHLQDLSTWLTDKLSPTKNLTRAKDQLHAAILAADKAIDPDAALGSVQAAWNNFVAIPAVSKTLTKLEPVTKWGKDSFFGVHDWLVNSWYYKHAFDLSGNTLTWATTTTPYKLSTRYLYPWVEPVAAPAIGKLSNSKSIGVAINYWKPAGLTV